MTTHDIIGIGASAGGIEALSELLPTLPANLPATLFIVMHVTPESPNVLPNIFNRMCKLPIISASDGDLIEPGRVFFAVSDHHLLVERGRVRVVMGPKENHTRPAVDPLFRSAAFEYGPRVIGVVLSGNLDDGTAGLQAIKKCGGLAVVQDPREALYPGMPQSAVDFVQVDHVVPVARIGELLTQLVELPAPSESRFPLPEREAIELQISEKGVKSLEDMNKLGEPSAFTCPDCGGTMWQIEDGELLRFRCHTGHAFTSESLEAQQLESLESTLWAALRSMQESISLSRQVSKRAREHKREAMAMRFELKAREAEEHVATLREMLAKDQVTS